MSFLRSNALGIALLSACSTFKTAPLNDMDGSTNSSDGNEADAADGSTPQPPTDFECTGAWKGFQPVDPNCAHVRTVTKVEPSAITEGGISIARTAAGRIGIAYDDAEDADDLGLRVAHFVEPKTAVDVIAPKLETFGFGVVSHVGRAHALSANGPEDTLHLAYVDEDVAELHYQRLENGASPFTPVELVASGVGTGALISLGVSVTGDVRTAYYIPGSTAALFSRARKSTGGFGAATEVVNGLDPDAPGTGQSWILFDDSGTPNLLFQHCELPNFSTPRYHSFDGTEWSYRKTIDNNVLDGYAGYSPSLVVFGSQKYAAYYFFKAGQNAPYSAELHLAQWSLDSDTPTITILDQAIPASDPVQSKTKLFRFASALAIDSFGLLHLAVIRPDGVNMTGGLEYHRQALVGGEVKWLVDIVDDDVLSDPSSGAPDAFVAITVDSHGRPHIAYRSGKDGNIYYATRFDR